MNALLISGIFASLIFSVFFTVVESAYHGANKLQLDLEGRMGGRSRKLLAFLTKHPAWLIGTTMIGSTVALVVFTTLLSIGLVPIIHQYVPNHPVLVLIIQSFVAGAIILFAAALLPKMLSVLNPNRVLSFLSYPFFVLLILLFPFTFSVLSLSRFFIVRVFGMKYDESKPFIGTPDVKHYESTSEISDGHEDIALDKKIFHNALSFKTVKIRDCMIPRTEITSVELYDPIAKLREAFVESGHSKVIIYKQSIDEIVGYSHSSSLFKRPDEIREVLTPIIITAENASANELMIRFIKERRSLAVVIDEFGGTSGIVSMEDIIEEIFGEIDDEHDQEDAPIEEKIDENTYLLSARLRIDYLNETYSWQLPTGEYETLGGLILSYTEDFPKQGQLIELPPYLFIIQATGNNRIDTVSVHLESPPNELS